MDEVISDVARAIRPHLGELLGSDAKAVDDQLVGLLRRGRAGQAVDDAIVAVFEARPRLRNWAASMLADSQHLPPDVQLIRERGGDAVLSSLPNPNGGGVIAGRKFACPVDGDFVWWRTAVGQPIKRCPDHPDQSLVPI